MKLKEIYITKEGEPMANPNHMSKHEQYHSGLLPFEDREKVERLLPRDAFEFFPSNGNPFGGGYRPKPDTLIPVDIEVEVVTQNKSVKIYDDDVVNWMDIPSQWMNEFPKDFKYRKGLRIKP